MVKQTVTEKPTTAGNSSGDERNDGRFKGVRKRKWGKYVSEIRLPNSRERIWLGSYDTAEKAARAFDAALFCLRGRSAKFNFPDSPPDIAGGRSLTPTEIQAAAARFANTEAARDPRPERPEASSWSPSASESSLTAQPEYSELANDTSYMNLFENMGSGQGYDSGYGLFPGFDELGGDFYAPPYPVGGEYAAEDTYIDGALPPQEYSYLWNF